MQVTLTKLSDKPNALRSKVVVGYAAEQPEAGVRFRMFAKGFDDPSLLRLVETSVVQECVKTDDGDFEFKTESGTLYRLEVANGKA